MSVRRGSGRGNYRSLVAAAVVIGFLCLPRFAPACTRGVPKQRDYRSSNGAFVFRLIPISSRRYQPGQCQGALYAVVGQKQKLAWSRNLINNWAPQRVYVSDSGKYVVTFDEWDDDGHLPVVIYGARGRLLAVHNLESLGLLADLRHIEMSTLGVQWKDAAVALFGPNEDRFLVRLHWGRIIVLGLPHGELLADARGAEDSARDDPQWRALLQCVEERVRETALRWLQSESAPERKDGALISGQLQLREAIPRLRDLLTDHTWVRIRYGSRPWVREFYVRKQAATALRAMGEVVKGVVFEIQEGE